jgi:hypothetical protein
LDSAKRWAIENPATGKVITTIKSGDGNLAKTVDAVV